MAYQDLREWLNKLEAEKQLARVKAKVDWNLEVGGITQEVFDRQGPALLFENIKDHEATLCRRLFTASLATFPRIALALGLPQSASPREIITTMMKRGKESFKPKMVSSGPVKETIIPGDKVNLLDFPSPRWHHRDGGRYLGTCDGVVTRDPETGWINVGLYRRMVHDRNHLGITIAHGQHIWLHWRKYRQMGKKTMPVALVLGWDPVFPLIACAPCPPEVCEYDIMSGLRGRKIELVQGETVDLPVPAAAEIVLEGEISLDMDSFRMEGPFGEHHGYYTSVASRKPVITIHCITCRHDPIMQGTMEGVPTNESDLMTSVNFSAFFWDHLNTHMPGVTGVYAHPSSIVFVQIDNSYITQPQQVAYLIWGLSAAAVIGKNIMVVDQDIDIFDLDKLAWAFATRVDPARDILQVPGPVQVTDPVVHPRDRVGVRGQTIYKATRLLIDATKYLGNPRTDEWFGERFAPVCRPDEKTMNLVRQRWSEYGIS